MAQPNPNLPKEKREHHVSAELLDRYGLNQIRQKTYKHLLEEAVPAHLSEDTLNTTRKVGHVGRLAILEAAQILDSSTRILTNAAAASVFSDASFEEPKHIEFLNLEHNLGINLHTDIFNDSAHGLLEDQQYDFLYIANYLFTKSRIAAKGDFGCYSLDDWLGVTLHKFEGRFREKIVRGDYKDNKKTLAEAFQTEFNETRIAARLRNVVSFVIHLGKDEAKDERPETSIMNELSAFNERLQKSPQSVATGEIVGTLMCVYLVQTLS